MLGRRPAAAAVTTTRSKAASSATAARIDSSSARSQTTPVTVPIAAPPSSGANSAQTASTAAGSRSALREVTTTSPARPAIARAVGQRHRAADQGPAGRVQPGRDLHQLAAVHGPVERHRQQRRLMWHRPGFPGRCRSSYFRKYAGVFGSWAPQLS